MPSGKRERREWKAETANQEIGGPRETVRERREWNAETANQEIGGPRETVRERRKWNAETANQEIGGPRETAEVRQGLYGGGRGYSQRMAVVGGKARRRASVWASVTLDLENDTSRSDLRPASGLGSVTSVR